MLVVAAGVIWRDGKVLLTQRRQGDTLGGMWEFPGGKIKTGESPIEAVVRECQEECAIVIEPVDILDVAFHSYPQRDILLLFYDCHWRSGEVQHLEVADHAWVLPSDVSGYELPPADVNVVRKIQERGAI